MSLPSLGQEESHADNSMIHEGMRVKVSRFVVMTALLVTAGLWIYDTFKITTQLQQEMFENDVSRIVCWLRFVGRVCFFLWFAARTHTQKHLSRSKFSSGSFYLSFRST